MLWRSSSIALKKNNKAMKEINQGNVPLLKFPINYGQYSILEDKLYNSYFLKTPSHKTIQSIDVEKLIKWIDIHWSSQIVQKIIYEFTEKRKSYCTVKTYILSNEIMIHFDISDRYVRVYFTEQEEQSQAIIENAKKFWLRSKKPACNFILVVPNQNGLGLKSIENKKPKLSLHQSYNDDLVEVHSKILKSLKSKKANGLILLHGMPGTGKSTYIRYVMNYVGKKIIFLSSNLANNLGDPQFTLLLMDNPDSIIIIEDAEELLVSRDRASNSGIAMLLNLTDGLLGASLNIQFVCTFNTDLQNIDKALLRKGRLTALYEFRPLTIEKSKALLSELGKSHIEVTEPMTLADIYGADEKDFNFKTSQKKIGFNVQAA